ncbi:MAG TPA: undecaprenyl-diphosphate phosphatase [Armatimonadota bacterium]
MNVLAAIILGAIQGLTEFLPISSSAHLAIIHKLFGWNTSDNLLFDVLLHVGTLVALFAYFWREWADMIKANIALSRIKDTEDPAYVALKGKTMPILPILIACVPAAISGFLLEKVVAAKFDNAALIACMMIIMGLVMAFADRTARRIKSLQKTSVKDWLVIGLAQAFAVIPGVSRSGVTITAGLFCGLKRDAAAKTSFMLGTPLIFGAAVFELRKVSGLAVSDILPMLMGLGTSALVGYISIGYLLEYLKKRGVASFVLYRIVFGLTVLALYAGGLLR